MRNGRVREAREEGRDRRKRGGRNREEEGKIGEVRNMRLSSHVQQCGEHSSAQWFACTASAIFVTFNWQLGHGVAAET